MNDQELLGGLSGAVLAVVPLLQSAVRPAVVIKAAALGGNSCSTAVREPRHRVTMSRAR
jgi:hypothetical protein